MVNGHSITCTMTTSRDVSLVCSRGPQQVPEVCDREKPAPRSHLHLSWQTRVRRIVGSPIISSDAFTQGVVLFWRGSPRPLQVWNDRCPSTVFHVLQHPLFTQLPEARSTQDGFIWPVLLYSDWIYYDMNEDMHPFIHFNVENIWFVTTLTHTLSSGVQNSMFDLNA